MTFHRPHDFAPLVRALGACAATLQHVTRRLAAFWRHRNDMAVLASLDERNLADIGLTRADVRDAVSLPPWRDPTTVLADRRRERTARDYRAIFTQLVREQNSRPMPPGAEASRYPPTNRPARFTL